MSSLTVSDTFEYLCYGCVAIIDMFTLTVRGSTLDFRIYGGQILRSKVDPRAMRINHINAVVYC